MEVNASKHKRSNSDLPRRKNEEDNLNKNFEASPRLKLDMGQLKNCVKTKKKLTPNTEVQGSLKEEILHLQKRLQDQFVVRRAFEKALDYESFSRNPANEIPMIKPAKDLIREIAVLESEVVYLEQYLLSQYRKTFDKRVSSLSTMVEKLQPTSVKCEGISSEASGHGIVLKKENLVAHSCHLFPLQNSVDNPPKECNDILETQKLSDSDIHRSYSSLSHRSACSIRISPPTGIVAEAVHSYHSLPLSMLERPQGASSNVISLAEHLGTRISDHVPPTPNWVSEEMIKSISSIYCKLADPPLINHDYSFSPTSFSSSLNEFSPRGQHDTGSPESRKYSSFNSNSDTFQVEVSEEFSGPYCTMVEVQWICRDSKKLRDVEPMLKSFRSLVCQLKEVDPRKMKHEEKLAFWINVHNALVMHAFLVHGIPKNNLKRTSLVLKAAYNVGGQTISVDTIESSILGCRLPRPGQWFRFLFSSRTKFKSRDPRRVYAIEHPQPLLHFALSSGSHSDPAIRLYTPKRVYQELEAAKEEYIQMTFRVHKEHKIILPKIVESFSKDLDMSPAGLMEMIEHFMPDSLRKSIQKSQRGKLWKSIEWIPHSFTFRYLLSNELAK